MTTPVMTLPQLKRSRTSRQVIIEKLFIELNDAIQADDVLETERCLTLLELKEAVLLELAQDLENLTTDDAELDVAINENSAFADKIVGHKIKANRMLSRHRTVAKNVVSASPVQQMHSAGAIGNKVNTKLPKLLIKKFDGSIQDWERFHDQFQASVDSNTSISDVDKFSYLKGYLTENASLTIAGLSLTSANYVIAKDLLLKKYGQPDVLIAEHVKQLLEIRKVGRIDNGQELRSLMENYQVHLRALEILGKNVQSMGTLLCPTLLKCLPHQMIREWYRVTKGAANDNLTLLLEFIRTEVEGIELACRSNIASSTPYKDVKKGQKSDTSVTSASTLLTAGSENVAKKKRPCVFCSSYEHNPSVCPENKTVEERTNSLRRQQRCFRCLQQSHIAKQCPHPYKCKRCNKNHHTLICDPNKSPANRMDYSNVVTSSETTPKAVLSSESTGGISKTLIASAIGKTPGKTISVLQTLRVWIKHKGGLQRVVLLLDGGSERTFIRQSLVQKLQLPCIHNETLTVFSFGGKRHTQQSKRVQLTLVGQDSFSMDISALEVSEICSGVTLWESSQIEMYLNSQKQRFNWNQAMGSGEPVTIDVLVGADYYWQLVTGHMKRISPFLMATQTVFGWTLQGNAGETSVQDSSVSMFVSTESTESNLLHDKVTELWELDRTGIMSKEEACTRTLQDEEVHQQFQDTIECVDDRYLVNIPWNENKATLCRNFALAKQRLKGLLLKLQQNPLLLERYRQGIYEYLGNNHTEEVKDDDVTEPIFYLPHHPIIKEDRKTTKLRIVFDGSAHDFSGKSLNQCQSTGPNLNPTIMDLLLRFRQHRIGITSDIEKAFLQVQLKPEERNATRFLWTDEEWQKTAEPTLKTFRMTRVLFGMKSSPYLLAATIRYHLKRYALDYPLVSDIIDRNIYIDDLITGAEDTQQALFISTQALELMNKASMPLKKWATNDVVLRENWAKLGMISINEPMELLKVLGLMWDPSSDCLFFKTTELFKAVANSKASKRSILEILARIFDPLGIITPKLVILKLLLQDLWRMKLPWDEDIPENLKKIWEDWKVDLDLLSTFKLSRWYQTSQEVIQKSQLHVFCDASLRAYGAVAYLRIEGTDQQFQTVLIASKARIAPLKLISIPRLELLACVLGARLAASLKEAWSQETLSTHLWTDSQVTLQWLTSQPSRWKVFVARRVQEVQSLTKTAVWHFCISKDNPADFLSKGQNLQKLMQNKLWWEGPQWLKCSNVPSITQPEPTTPELIQVEVEEIHTLTIIEDHQKEGLLNLENYSKWQKIVRVTAWIIRFLQNCSKIQVKKHAFLTIFELRNAELYWFKYLQQKMFPKEIQALKENRPLDTCSTILQFQPFLDRAQTMRIGGRLQKAELCMQQKHPILLKGGGTIDLFVLDRHEKTLHGGIQSTLQKIREDVWLIKGRQSVRSAIYGCRNCKKWIAKPITVTEAPLPEARIGRSMPFQVTGVDFAGPIWAKLGQDKVKAYICLFTCAVTRSLHLELVQTQNIKHFLWALRRFVARRGNCQLIYSDNAATFKMADRLIQESLRSLQHNDIQELATQLGIEWRFIMPRAPWWGGFYERMVSNVKHHLRRTLGSTLMSHEELATLLTEIESVINARPLATLTDDVRDSPPLTPSHFLIGRTDGPLTDILPALNTIPAKPNLLKRWQYRKRLMENFWKQWSREYILQLQSMHKVKVPGNQILLKIGDVVLLKEEKLPRGMWKLARIEELFIGRDGRTRSALLRTAAGTPLRRAVQHLCPLEVV